MSIRRAQCMRGLRVVSSGAVARGFTRSLLLAVVALTGVLAFSTAPALAATGHKFLSSISEAPPGTPLNNSEAVTIDPTTGNVFVVAGEDGIDVFNSAGVFQTKFGSGVLEGESLGIAVDRSGRVYVADLGTNTLDVFKPNGSGGYELLSQWSGANTPATEFSELGGVAVDNSTSKSDPSAGEVYVLDKGASAVYVFKPKEGPEEASEGSLLTILSGGKPELEELGGVAVNSATGQVYLAGTKEGETGFVEVFNSAHVFESKLAGKGAVTGGLGPLGAVAVREATGEVYVADTEAGAVDQLNPAGEWMGWVQAGPDGQNLAPLGLAVAAGGQLYVSSGLVDVFGPNVTVPDVKTGSGKSSKTKPVVVTLSGTINPLGNAKYHFEYGQEGRFTGTTPVVEASGSAELKVTAAVEGLKPGELYNFRLVAESEEKVTTYGQTVFFLTAEAVAGVATGPALNVTPTSATLTGSLEPQKFVTKYYFEWGETSSYGHNSPVPFGVTSATGVVPVETNLTGLKTSTTYHYRLVASNQFGISYGGDASFSTSGPGITIQPAAPIGHTTATLNAKVNPNKLETKYHFEYGETAAYGTSTKEEVLAAGIEKPEPVKAELTGLKLATTYHFRVVATNAAGTVNGPDQEFTTVLIENESATALTGETALLQAEVNPLGVNTSCQFEYGTSPSYGSTVPCEPTPGSSATPVLVSGHVKGLTPNTTYHYRVTATVEGIAEKGNGPDREFTTPASGASFKLPDSRGYEMVSPPNKQGGFIQPITAAGGVIQASEDGNALAYIANGPVREDVEGNRAPESQQILGTRGSTAWSSQEIVPPHERPAGLRVGQAFDEYLLFSGDLSLGVVQPFSFALTPFAEPPLSPPMAEAERKPCPESTSVRPCQEKTMYLRNNAPIPPASETAEETIYNEARQNGETLAKEHGEAEAKPGYLPLVSAANVAPGAKFGGTPINQTSVNPSLEFLDATQDLSHVVFLGKVALAPQPPSAAGLYEWGANKLQLVSVLPNGEPAPGATVSLGFSFQNNGRGANYRHAISDDGSRVVWTSEETNHLGHLYVRDTAKAQTLQLDTVEAGLPTPEKGEAFFQIASADGSRVFFTDSQRLTAGSTAGLAKPDLYECEVTEVAGKLGCKGGVVDLTVDHNAGESAAVQRLVLGASEDGSYVYFVATGVLAGTAQAGANNLYVLHYDGTKWTTSFIARLSSEDAPDWSSRSNANEQLLTNMTSRVSPNGTYLAFMSNRSLTGYNNIDVNEETGKHADEEVFLYSAGSQSLTCASCNPTGARPRGVFDTEFAGEGSGLVVDKPQTWMFGPGGFNVGTAHWLAGSIPGWTTLTILRGIYQSRYLSDSGRLFFNSADALVPEAAGATRTETIEGKEATVGVENVYEYQPNEVGSCRAGTGCVSLISSASSGKESAFLDASANGNDVYFLTAAKLLPQDEDSSYDVYDARVCGESGCQPTPEKPPPPCGNIPECRGGSSGAPTFAPPPGFSGPGNTLHKVGTGETLPSKAKKPPLTRAQKLALALKSCRKLAHKTRAQKKKRAKCESVARKKYGPKKAAKHAKRPSSAGRGR